LGSVYYLRLQGHAIQERALGFTETSVTTSIRQSIKCKPR
jgi:hypothetical protein